MNSDKIQSLLLGLVGGVAGAFLWGLRPQAILPSSSGAVVTSAAHEGTVAARDFQLMDASGHLRAQLALSNEGSPGLFFFDKQGKVRLVLGVYPPAEGELPFVVLNDSSQNAAGLFRLVGGGQVPFVIFKHAGQDRAIMGLSEKDTESVFLQNIKTSGRKFIFGEE